MEIRFKTIKVFTLLITFLLFSFGRLFNLFFLQKQAITYAIQLGVLYGILAGFFFYFIVDLFLAVGLLQVKIKIIKILSLFSIIILVVNNVLLKQNLYRPFFIPFLIEAVIVIVLLTVLIITDNRFNKKKDYILNKDNKLPDKYRKKHPLKTLLETFFRLFPYPEPVGLYKIGKPDKNSIVIVTGNYDLTIRRVIRSLKKIDLWLLICDSRGINIWCSSLANHFNAEKIIEAINLTKLKVKINHRKLILPQLCAGNVLLKTIKEKTGFSCKFGPVKIKDLKKYLKEPENTNIRKVTFNIIERLEMAAGTLVFPVIFLVFIFNFFALSKLIIIIPAIYFLSFISAVIYPYRFIRNIRLWSVFFGIVVLLINWILFTFILKTNFWIYSLTISIGIIYLINEFEGWSPLVKFNMLSAYNKVKIDINNELCIGCKRCILVCPKGVFEVTGKKSKVVNLSECISCKSCFTQCPQSAIDHSL